MRSFSRLFMFALLSLAAGAHPQDEFVIVKEGTGLYHRPACPVIRDGVSVLALTRAQAEQRGLKAHETCDPSNPKYDPPTAREAAPGKPQPKGPVFVVVDRSKYYHRDVCAKLGADRTKVDLEVAGKKYWPCPTCKPPVRRKSDGPAVPKRWGRG